MNDRHPHLGESPEKTSTTYMLASNNRLMDLKIPIKVELFDIGLRQTDV